MAETEELDDDPDRAERQRRLRIVALGAVAAFLGLAFLAVAQLRTTPAERTMHDIAWSPIGGRTVNRDRLLGLWDEAVGGDDEAADELLDLLSDGHYRPVAYGPAEGVFASHYDVVGLQCVVVRWFDDGTSALEAADRSCEEIPMGGAPSP
jgi:hypothetical protein